MPNDANSPISEYVLIARIPLEGVEAFGRYEEAVLPLLAEHGGALRNRWSSADGTVEVHILRFRSPAALETFRAHPRRTAAEPLLIASGAVIELIPVQRVPAPGAV